MSPPTPTSIALINGKYFDYLAPDPSVIDLDVLAAGMRMPRFNGQTDRLIPIGEHSLRVGRIACELSRVGSWSSTALAGNLHDGHEPLVPWGDCLSPGKTDAMREVETEVDKAIWKALKIDWVPSASLAKTVRTADAIALYFEAMLWGGPLASDWAPVIMDRVWEDLRGPNEFRSSLVERFMPLVEPRPGEDWRAQVEELLS